MSLIDTENIDFVEQIVVILQQEGHYRCRDYLSPNLAQHEQKDQIKPQVRPLSSDYTSPSSSVPSLVNEEKAIEQKRELISAWIFQVIDHCDLDRELASVSLNYLDRYLSRTCHVNSKTLQLAAMTSLFLAIKVYDSGILKLSSLVEMSQGRLTNEHVISMENSILWTLSWRVHPPTPLSFIRNFMSLLEKSGCSATIAHKIEDVATFLTELSVCDYYFTTHKSSSIGLGALLIAFDSIDEPTLTETVRQNFLNRVQSIPGLDSSSKEIQECKHHLYNIYLLNTEIQQQEDRRDLLKYSLIDRTRPSPHCVANIT